MTSRCRKNGLQALRTALCTEICWLSAVARVTSVKSLSVHRCRNIWLIEKCINNEKVGRHPKTAEDRQCLPCLPFHQIMLSELLYSFSGVIFDWVVLLVGGAE